MAYKSGGLTLYLPRQLVASIVESYEGYPSDYLKNFIYAESLTTSRILIPRFSFLLGVKTRC